MPTRPPRVYIQRFNTTQVRVEAPATSRRARDGELFFDPETRTLRLGNGVAAGGVILAGPSGDVSSQLVNGMATFSLQSDGDVVLEGTLRDAEGNDLLAIANEAPSIDPASSTVLGGVKLGEGFSLDGSNKVTTSKLYSTNLTQPNQHYRMELDTNGVVHLPDQSIINGATLRVVPGTGELNYAALAAGPTTQQAEKTWIWADANGAWVETDSYDAAWTWHFDNSGNLILPEGGSVLDSNGASIGTYTADFAFDTIGNRSVLYVGSDSANSTISLSTSGPEGSAYIEIPGDNAAGNGLNIYNTGTNGRIYARAQELVEFESNNSDILLSTDGGQWRFRKDGKLEFPNSTKQDTAIYATGSVTTEPVNYVDDYADPIAAGMTSVDLEAQELSSDDDKVYIQLPFQIKVFGRVISDITVSSNGYIVFEKEFSEGAYYPQGDQNDFLNHVKAPFLSIFGHDNSWQKVWTKATVDQFILRWEGNLSNGESFGGTSNLIYNVVFHAGSEQIDVYCVAGTGSTFSFVSNSWANVYEFNNYPGNAYIIRTSPHLYDANGDITMPAGGSIKGRVNEDLYLTATDLIDDGYEVRLSMNNATDEVTRVALDVNEVRIYTDMSGSNHRWSFEGGGYLQLPGPVYAYNNNAVMYSVDTGSGLTYASLESRSALDNTVFTTLRATPNGAIITTNLDNVAKDWTFDDAGNLTLPGSNVIGTGVVPAISGGTTSVTNYAYDATGTTVVLTSGDTVDFPSFSGSILVNSYNGGGVTQYLCGGGTGNATAIGSSKVGAVGSMAFNGAIGGYTFTANETGEHCFYVIRTRTGG